MDEVDDDEQGVPDESVQGAYDHVAPDGEEEAPDHQRTPQVQDTVDTVRCQIG